MEILLEANQTSSRPHKGVKASANSDVMYFFTSAQDGNPVQDDVRLCLSDDLKKAQDHTRVESSGDEEDLGEDASKQGRRIHDIDSDEDITLVNDDANMFDVNTLTGDEVLAEQEVAAKDVNLTVDEVTLAQALAALKSVKPKVKANVIEEPSVPVSAASTKVSAATTITTATIPTPRKGIVITELGTSTTTTTTTISSQPSQAKVREKGKGILVEEQVKLKKKDLIRLDEEIALKLQAEFDEEERLAREKDEANVALTKEWDDIQAKVDADYQLAQRLQAQEQEELTDEEKARLFIQFLEQRRKHFAAKKAEEKRNKPPTQDQQRKIMCTYLKNMEGKKPKDLKNKYSNSIQKMFDKAFKRVNTFVDFFKGSSKRAGTELEQEATKKQKVDDVQETAEVDDDQEIAKIKELMEIVPDKEEVAIDAILLAVKPLSIGRIVGIKRLLDDLRVTAAQVCVTAAKLNWIQQEVSYKWDNKYFGSSLKEVSSVSATYGNSSLNDTSPSTSISVVDVAPPIIPSTLEEHSSPEKINFVDASNQEDNVAVDVNEFVKPFSTLHPSEYQWTKAHPLEQILSDPSKPVMTRSKLATDDEM
ncbi:hypothetical protein Tco_0698142 [Tanacetum coccineum]